MRVKATRVFYRQLFCCLGCFLFLLSGCAPAPANDHLSTSTPSPAPSATVTAAPTATTAPTQTPTITPVPPLAVCSPLEGLALDELNQIVTNPLATPHPGTDDGHHGIDLAFYRWGTLTTMKGLPVLAALPGVVAAVVENRPPYGNMVIIETPLETISQAERNALELPAAAPTIDPTMTVMQCPDEVAAGITTNTGRSVYLLYAHMENKPLVVAGDSVACGQPIGTVGTTGMSVNEHLHLEARVGPGGARFKGMAFYDTGASEQELSSYCLWRTSRTFQLLNPLSVLLTLKK